MAPTTSRSVLIPAGPRRRSRIATLLSASAVALLAGCGGSDPQFTRDSVQDSMTAVTREALAKKGFTMDPLDCVMDGDQYHWRCIAYLLKGSQRFKMTTQITCDAQTGECLSEPQSIGPA